MKLSRKLSDQVFQIANEQELSEWLHAVEKEVGGVVWMPLGGIPNNVHTVEVASDPALALVERPTNSIDGLLDLKAREFGQTAPTPHDAAKLWWGVPAGGLTAMREEDRRKLADLIRVTMIESGDGQRPTVNIEDKGTGQHPDAFGDTHLSLLRSNKKSLTHQMGVYNAGGAASYKFSKGVVIVSRLAPSLLDGRADEIGVSVVRYNPLDPDRYKSGVYEYMAAKDKTILRLDLPSIPDIEHGTYVKLVEYQLPKYSRGAHEPKHSLWHLFHAALPDPALPFRIIETRSERFTALKGVERRVVTGLLHLLSRPGTADYSDARTINMGISGKIILRYFVLNEGTDPDAYTTSDQGLTITLNGQRQTTRDRLWLRRQLELYYLYKRLVVLVDGTALTNAAKREVFSATREHGVDSPLTKTILDRVIQELNDDEDLYNLDELAKQRTLEDATKSTTEKVKRQLATEIAAYLKGEITGSKGGRKKRRVKHRPRRGPVKPPATDDSHLPEVPNKLLILTKPIRIPQGEAAPLRLEINAKNGFLPKHADGLSVVLGPELKDHVKVVSHGRLLGGHVRVTLEASADAPVAVSTVKVALVVPGLGVLLTDEGTAEVFRPKEDKEVESKTGGQPNIDIRWVGREKWEELAWDGETVGDCYIYREDPADRSAITKVEWVLNNGFGPYEKVVEEKKLGEDAMRSLRERYEYAVALGLFKQRLAELAKETEADEEGKTIDIPDDYVKGERARLGRAVLMAMEPEVSLAEVAVAG